MRELSDAVEMSTLDKEMAEERVMIVLLSFLSFSLSPFSLSLPTPLLSLSLSLSL